MLFEDTPAARTVTPETRAGRRCRLSWDDGNGMSFRCTYCPVLTGEILDADTPLFALILSPCVP